jgi:hypothetical protein
MAQAARKTEGAATPTNARPALRVVTGPQAAVLPPHLVAKARKAAKAARAKSKAEKDLRAADKEFSALMEQMGVEILTDAAGNVVCEMAHGGQTRLDQERLRLERPTLVEQFTAYFPWAKPAYPSAK